MVDVTSPDDTASNPSWRLSPKILKDLVRAFDFLIVLLTGFGLYALLVVGGLQAVEPQYTLAILLGAPVALTFFNTFNSYRADVLLSPTAAAGPLLGGWAVTIGLLLILAFVAGVTDGYSRSWGTGWAVLAPSVLILGRCALAGLVRSPRTRRRFAQRTVIVGTGEIGRQLARNLLVQPDPRIDLIGFIDDRRRADDPKSDLPMKLLGSTDELIRLARRGLVDQVFVALPWSATERVQRIVKKLEVVPLHVCMAPDLVSYRFPNRAVSSVAGLMTLDIAKRPLSGWSYVVKSIEDRVIALLAIVALLPLMAVVAAAIKLDSPGPVLFRQKRYGFNNRLIEVTKFRSMYADMADADCALQTTRDDPRVTRVGAILRRTSLDELPQVFDVLRGEMSIVGPRPHAVATKAEGMLFEEVLAGYAARHRVKPGITGWAQINGWRGETDTIEKLRRRVEHDLYYIENWSLVLDLYIILKTVTVAWRQDTAY